MSPPPAITVFEENYEVAPSDLVLDQVHVYARNGHRIPHERGTLKPFGFFSRWRFCRFSHENTLTTGTMSELKPDATEKDKKRDPVNFFSQLVRVVTDVENGFDPSTKDFVAREDQGVCEASELTDRGRRESGKLGSAFRRIYVDKVRFLPETAKDENTFYYRSTTFRWTRESLYAMMGGLYPRGLRKGVPTVHVREQINDDIAENLVSCPRFAMLRRFWYKVAAENFNPALMELDQYLSKYVHDAPIRLDGQPPLRQILDFVKSLQSHDFKKTPSEFEHRNVIKLMEKAVLAETLGGYQQQEYRSLGIGRLFANLLRTMTSKVRNQDDDLLKFRLFCVPGTSIGAVLVSLGAFRGEWTPFCSSLTFELYKYNPPLPSADSIDQAEGPEAEKPAVSSPSTHYVRALYQAKPLTLPTCAERQHHYPGRPELCTFEAFSSLVQTLAPKDYWQQCLDMNSPVAFEHGPFVYGVPEPVKRKTK